MRESKHILTFFFAGTKKGSTFAAGEMAERSNAAVLKTVVRLSADRGFESLFLRAGQEQKEGAFAYFIAGCSNQGVELTLILVGGFVK